MGIINNLRDLLSLTPESTETEIIETFSQIAKIMISDVAIQKGSSYYRFSEIEFYFFNKNHKDIITHPRICDALKWYVNDFGGLDLSFQSHIDTRTVLNSQKKEITKPFLNENDRKG